MNGEFSVAPPTVSKIDEPGWYDGIPNEVYHGDCCVGPAISHSGAHRLVTTCPAKFWFDSPLNPEFEPEQATKFDIGTAAHLIVLEPDALLTGIAVIAGFDDYRTKDARAARDEAYAAGKTPLLEHQRDQVFGMARALHAHPLASQIFVGGHSERSYFAKDPRTGVWLKARPDYERDDGLVLADYKTTTSAHPEMWKKRLADMGHYSQDPWYRDVVELVRGVRPKQWFFVVQETEAPYLVSVFTLPQAVQDWGRLQNRKAIDKFARCLKTGDWHGYRDHRSPDRDTAFEIELPRWAEFALQDKHDAGEFTAEHAALSMEYHRPI